MSDAPLIPAATLVLMSRQDAAISVLLLQRSPTLKAFPGLWAFPGGRVDAIDRDDRWLSEMRPAASVLAQIMRLRDRDPISVNTKDYLQRMRIQAQAPHNGLLDCAPAELWPYWVAAVRECHEETGLSIAGWEKGSGLDFRSLYYLGRLVPPPQVPYRFDTRFFAALIDPTPVVLRGAEATTYRWMGVAQALAELVLANPTRYVLEWLSQWRTLADFEDSWGKDGTQWSI